MAALALKANFLTQRSIQHNLVYPNLYKIHCAKWGRAQRHGEGIGNELKHSWNQTWYKCLLANTHRHSLLPSCLINLGSIFIFLGAETVMLEHLGRLADWVCSLSCRPESCEEPPTARYTEGRVVKILVVAASPELFKGGCAIGYSNMFILVQDNLVQLT